MLNVSKILNNLTNTLRTPARLKTKQAFDLEIQYFLENFEILTYRNHNFVIFAVSADGANIALDLSNFTLWIEETDFFELEVTFSELFELNRIGHFPEESRQISD